MQTHVGTSSMITKASPCLKYSRPRLAAKRPMQQRMQISPVKFGSFLRFINSDDHHKLASLKQLNNANQAALVLRSSRDNIFRPADGICFTSGYFTTEDRCLKIAFGKLILSQLVFSMNRKDIFPLSCEGSDLIEYTWIHYSKTQLPSLKRSYRKAEQMSNYTRTRPSM